MTPIKVVIADDHALFRDGLRKILSLEKDILVVGEAANSEEVPKVVEPTRVMILTAFSDDENVLNAAKGGAKGYVSKGVPSTVLLQAIKTVHSGGSWIDKEISSWEIFEEILQGHSDPRDGEPKLDESIKTLTKREMEILRLVAEGLTNEEIGKKIFISEKTVKTHLTNIFDKLKVNNRFKAALMLMGHPH